MPKVRKPLEAMVTLVE